MEKGLFGLRILKVDRNFSVVPNICYHFGTTYLQAHMPLEEVSVLDIQMFERT